MLGLSLGLPYSFPSGGGGGGTAPATPANFTATAGDRAITLDWDAASGATEYDLYRYTYDNFGSSTLIQSGLFTTSAEDATPQPGELHYYWVVAKNAFGSSSPAGPDTSRPYVVIPNGDNASLTTPTGTWTLGTLIFGPNPTPLPDNLFIEAAAVLYTTFGGEWLDATTEDPANSVSISGSFTFTNSSGASFSFWTTEP